MPLYTIQMTHTALSCPIFNSEVGKRFKEGAARRERAVKKYNVNVVASCVDVLDHWILYIVKAEAKSAVEDYLNEIGLAYYNNVHIREVETIEEATKRWIT